MLAARLTPVDAQCGGYVYLVKRRVTSTLGTHVFTPPTTFTAAFDMPLCGTLGDFVFGGDEDVFSVSPPSALRTCVAVANWDTTCTSGINGPPCPDTVVGGTTYQEALLTKVLKFDCTPSLPSLPGHGLSW